MNRDEEGAELSEPLKVGLAVFVKIVGQVIQVCHTIFDDPNPLGIKPLGAIEKIHNTSADHSIQRHQRSLVLTSYLRPPLLLVGFPEGQHSISIHAADLQQSSLT